MSKQIPLTHRFLFFAKHSLIHKAITIVFYRILFMVMYPDSDFSRSRPYYLGMLINTGLLLVYAGLFALISWRMTLYNRSRWLLYFFVYNLLLSLFMAVQNLFGVNDLAVASHAGNFMLTITYLLVVHSLHKKQLQNIASEDDDLINSINIKTDS
ncbi:hypothetical protein MKQ70_34055 [Chitinophaga sedimenti]|uniref:hypothetical protein n=1 Tax=Chitinophaga sedimenti TaxID=2033606 RepID=UPI00200698A2|nr:hypothetical protein [Chitinophaga sedimenti]MCK7559700.1 hypothetical protein [Chitinophaga sedimenti]